MNITIHWTFLPHTDPDASLAFYRDTLGFEVRNDVGYDGMRWLTVGPPNQQSVGVVLTPPAIEQGITEAERQTVLEMIAKGTYATLVLGTDSVDDTFAHIQSSGAEVIQEPMDQPYGVRDCAFRDPAGNTIRFNQLV